jgi:hypothetical protein
MARKKGNKKKTTVLVVAPTRKQKSKKRGKGVRGKGDYVLPAAYRAVGADLGRSVGLPGLGYAAGAGVSMLRGHGDYYPVKSNSLIKGGLATPVPKFVNNGRRGVQIVEREFLGLVTTAQAFTLNSYPINPGMNVTFPWAATCAQQFEEYVIEGMLFEFVSLSADWNGTTQAIGSIIMATDYDSSDAVYSNRVQMENADYSCSARANQSLIHPVECDPQERPTKVSYVRSGAIPNNADIKMYDLGNFQIATDGFSTDGQVIGELWVSYDVVFYKKQINPSGQSSAAVYLSSDAATAANPFGLNANRLVWGICDIVPSGLTLTFTGLPLGIWELRCYWIGSTGNYSGAPVLASGTNCTINVVNSTALLEQGNVLYSPSSSRESSGTSTINFSRVYYFTVTGNNPRLTFTAVMTVPTCNCTMDLNRYSYGPLPLVTNTL